MYKNKYLFFLAIPVLMTLIFSCLPVNTNDTSSNNQINYVNVSASQMYSTGNSVYSVPTSGYVNLSYTMNIGSTPKDVYYVFTNTNTSTDANNPVLSSISGNITKNNNSSYSLSNTETYNLKNDKHNHHIQMVDEFNKNPFKYIKEKGLNNTINKKQVRA